MTYVSAELRRLIRDRADGRCEYCRISEQDAFFAHEPDHVIAEKHGGETTLENLAFACFDCNRFKCSDIASNDPVSGELMRLFNPRTDGWSAHFAFHEGTIQAMTGIGRATERLLKLNLPERVEIRQTLIRTRSEP
jgi:hypothetical protein